MRIRTDTDGSTSKPHQEAEDSSASPYPRDVSNFHTYGSTLGVFEKSGAGMGTKVPKRKEGLQNKIRNPSILLEPMSRIELLTC